MKNSYGRVSGKERGFPAVAGKEQNLPVGGLLHGFRFVRAGPFHAQAVYALRRAGSVKKTGAWIRPRATASANHSS